MTKDTRQLRTSNNAGLLGYRGRYRGENVIAIMKGKDCKKCLGILTLKQLNDMVKKGPYIELDEIYK